jgi:hypothetical protein
MDEAWHGQKNRVPSQPNVQTGFLRAAAPPPFILHIAFLLAFSPSCRNRPTVALLRSP